MQIELAPEYEDTRQGQAAQAILRQCVHCGFCAATCPSYQILGEESDSPRGRIYLIREMLAGAPPTRAAQVHLDRCLTCRNCESTCPSGVQYAQLLEVGRHIVQQRVQRPAHERFMRWALRAGLGSRWFALALRVGQVLRPVLPKVLRNAVPPRPAPHEREAAAQGAGLLRLTRQVRSRLPAHSRKVLLPLGCVQPALRPQIDAATVRVLGAAGFACVLVARDGQACCGAIDYHLGEEEAAIAQIKSNIDAWLLLAGQEGVDCIVSNASGCGVMVKDYERLLQHDALYAQKAARVSAMTRDLSEVLSAGTALLKKRLEPLAATVAYHPPCSLQHGQKLHGGVERLLRELGFRVETAAREAYLCCGSAGTYAVLQPKTAHKLRDRKLQALPAEASLIVSGNVGCITHLQSGTRTPVRHWVELVDQCIAPQE